MAQEEAKITAGFQFSPIIPSSIFRTGPFSGTVNTTTFTVSQKFGYNIGMIVQAKMWKNIWLEFGLQLSQRNYSLNIQEDTFNNKSTFGLLGYTIPVSIMVNIPLSEKVFFDNALGAEIDIFPSDEATKGDNYVQVAERIHEFNAALLASTGFKFTPGKFGSFYLGASYHLPFGDMYYLELQNTHDTSNPTLITVLKENYFCIDFKYLFLNKNGENK